MKFLMNGTYQAEMAKLKRLQELNKMNNDIE